MCGLYGIFDKTFGGLGAYDLAVFGTMGTITEVRGRHSSGCFAVAKDGKPSPLVKTVGPSVNLLFEKPWEKFKAISVNNGRAMIGHGRYATVGKVTKQNAHPFREAELTLVHNGTIRSGLDLAEHKVDVDSHALVKEIKSKGLKQAIESIHGAWAIIMYDEEKKHIQFLRNYERDLHYMETNGSVYVMSDKHALEFVKAQHKLLGEIVPFKANTLYTFDVASKTFVEGEEIKGNNYPKVEEYPAYWNNSFRQQGRYGNSRWRDDMGSNARLVSPHLNSPYIKRDYNVGDNIEFTVENSTHINNQVHFLARDKNNNEIRFTTGNQQVAQSIAKGDRGVGECSSFSIDHARKRVSYTLRFREIIWDVPNSGAAEGTELVSTYGDVQIKKSEWEIMCATQQCWACQGALDPNSPEETVIVRHGSVLKPYCPDCVADYRSQAGCLNREDKHIIQEALARLS